MKMFGHQNPADQQEMQFLPHLFQSLDKAAAKAVGKEERRPSIGAGSNELEFTGSVNAVIERHGGGEYTLRHPAPEENVPSGTQTPKIGCLRQPANRVAGGWVAPSGSAELCVFCTILRFANWDYYFKNVVKQ